MIKLEKTTAYTVKEVGEFLHKAPQSVRYYITTGQLKAKKVGNAYYITEKALEEFVTGEKPER